MPATFHQFSTLPVEIRIVIWEFAVHDYSRRGVHFYQRLDNDDRRFDIIDPSPSTCLLDYGLWTACVESFEVMAKAWTDAETKIEGSLERIDSLPRSTLRPPAQLDPIFWIKFLRGRRVVHHQTPTTSPQLLTVVPGRDLFIYPFRQGSLPDHTDFGIAHLPWYDSHIWRLADNSPDISHVGIEYDPAWGRALRTSRGLIGFGRRENPVQWQTIENWFIRLLSAMKYYAGTLWFIDRRVRRRNGTSDGSRSDFRPFHSSEGKYTPILWNGRPPFRTGPGMMDDTSRWYHEDWSDAAGLFVAELGRLFSVGSQTLGILAAMQDRDDLPCLGILAFEPY